MPLLTLTAEEWTAMLLSLKVAAVAVTFSLPLGLLVAWLLSRKDFWGKSLLNGLVHLPLILPPVVTGYLLLITFGRRGTVGAFLEQTFGLVFSFRWTGAALAAGIVKAAAACHTGMATFAQAGVTTASEPVPHQH